MKRLLLIASGIAYLTMGYLSAQPTRKLQQADALYNAGAYHDAIALYRDDIDKIKDKKELSLYLFKVGNCFRLIGEPRQAEQWYDKAIRRDCPNPKVYYYYAEMLKMNEKYDLAIEQYQKYKVLVPNDPLTDVGIQSCELAKQWIATPSGYEITNMRAINSKQSDFSPAYTSTDYNILYFTPRATAQLVTKQAP